MTIKGSAIVFGIIAAILLVYSISRNKDQVNYSGINMSREDAESLERLNKNMIKAHEGPKPLYERDRGAVYYSTNSTTNK